MRVLIGLRSAAGSPSPAVVTVGVFDGVHVAHQRLIRRTVQLARRSRASSVVVTFNPDPQTVLDPARAQPALMPLEARLAFFQALGVDWVWVVPFTKRFARVSAEQFIRRMLIRRLHTRALVVGETFVFGRDRRGGMELLTRIGRSCGMRVVSVRQITRGRAPVSSSRIRRLIAAGQLAHARRLLGRAPELYGEVVPGAGRGRALGFPTANLRLTSHVLPPPGVYAVLVRHVGLRLRRSALPSATPPFGGVPASVGRRRVWRGVTPPPSRVRGTRTAEHAPLAFGELLGGGVMNLGVRPTFGPGPLVCEVHLLGFSGTLLGESVTVSLLARLRGERCFPSPHALIHQVRRDLRRARQLFSRLA